MRKIAVLLAVAAMLTLSGCNGLQNDVKHMTSVWVGLERTITTYRPDGTKESVSTKSQIEYNGGMVVFIVDGKTHSWPANFTWVEEN